MSENQREAEPMRQFPVVGEESKGCSSHKLIKYTTLVLVSTFLLVAGTTSSVLVTQINNSSTLAIASDVIECAQYNLLYKISTIVVTENQFDIRNDNPKGLTVDLFTLNDKDIIYHRYVDTHENYELILPTSGSSRFIMPYNYYNRPWYFWSGSTIKISFKLVYNEKPTKVDLYLFKGETRINNFFSKKTIIPPYEEHLDMLSTNDSNSVTWQIKENDYYYIAIDTIAAKDTTFFGNFTFNFTYIDIDDYPWYKDTVETAMGLNHALSLHKSVSSQNNNRTLCYIHPIPPDSLESNSIHLNTYYYTDMKVKLLFIATPFGLFTLSIVILLACFYINSRMFHYKTRKGGYIVIN